MNTKYQPYLKQCYGDHYSWKTWNSRGIEIILGKHELMRDAFTKLQSICRLINNASHVRNT